MTRPLPAWCDTLPGRELVEQAIAEQPEFRITRGQWVEGGGQRRYIGKPAARLRRLHCDWLADQLAALDAQYEVSGHFDLDASAAIFAVEDADALIGRILRETAERAELEPKELPGGRFQVAA